MSNSTNPFIDVWKQMTVIYAKGTNEGIIHQTTDGTLGRLKKDKIYSPVFLNDDGEGIFYTSISTASGSNHKKPIGVLMESFKKPGVPHTVAIQGIVPMLAQAAVTGGEMAHVDADNPTKIITTVATGKQHLPIGICLESGSAGDYVPVLIGMV